MNKGIPEEKEITQQQDYYNRNREMILSKAKSRKKPGEAEREERLQKNLCIACGRIKLGVWKLSHYCSRVCWDKRPCG